MRILTETTLNRLVNGHDNDGYAIVSAFRHDCLGDKPSEMSDTEWEKKVLAENETRNQDLKYLIKKLGYSYVPVFGGYKESGTNKSQIEKSLVVFPYDLTTNTSTDFNEFESDLINVAKEYNQDAVLIKRPNEPARYFDCEKNDWSSFVFNGTTLNDVTQEYFTALKRWKDFDDDKGEWVGKPQRFSYVECYLEDAPQTIMGTHKRHTEGELVKFGV